MPRLVAVVLAMLAGLVTSSAAVSAPSAKQTIRVLSKFESGGFVMDKPPVGKFSAGDVIVGSDSLRNVVAQFGRPKGALVGRDRYRFAFKSATLATLGVTATLPGGTIRCQGTLRETTAKVAVMGTNDVAERVLATAEATKNPA